MDIRKIAQSNRSRVVFGAGVVAAGLVATATGVVLEDDAHHGGAHRAARTAAGEAEHLPSAPEAFTPSRWVGVDRFVSEALRTNGDGDHGTAIVPSASTTGSTPSAGGSGVAPGSDPHKVIVTLPQYHAGTAPTITPPSASGTPPSVSNDDGSLTISIPKDGQITPPTYTPGQPGQLDPPGVSVE